MKIWKKAFSFLLIFTLSLSLLSGCGRENRENEDWDEEEEWSEDEGLYEDELDEEEDLWANIPEGSLSEAVEKSDVRIEVRPVGIDTFLMDVTNISGEYLLLRCDLEAGYYLRSASGAYQNLLITAMDRYYMDVSDGLIALEPDETGTCGGDCACMNIHRDIPDETCGYALTRLEDSTLAGLVQLFKEENVSYDVRQAAVWIVTDDADEYDVQTLTVSYTDGSTETMINETEYAEALALVERARQMA